VIVPVSPNGGRVVSFPLLDDMSSVALDILQVNASQKSDEKKILLIPDLRAPHCTRSLGICPLLFVLFSPSLFLIYPSYGHIWCGILLIIFGTLFLMGGLANTEMAEKWEIDFQKQLIAGTFRASSNEHLPEVVYTSFTNISGIYASYFDLYGFRTRYLMVSLKDQPSLLWIGPSCFSDEFLSRLRRNIILEYPEPAENCDFHHLLKYLISQNSFRAHIPVRLETQKYELLGHLHDICNWKCDSTTNTYYFQTLNVLWSIIFDQEGKHWIIATQSISKESWRALSKSLVVVHSQNDKLSSLYLVEGQEQTIPPENKAVPRRCLG
jgi:hypothetical protein